MDAPTIRENLSTKFLYDKATAGSPSVGEVPLGGLDEVTLRSVEAIAGYEPGDYIARISPTPLMLVVAQHDILTHSDLAFAAYERALHPKQLVTLPGGHFVVCNREFKTVLAHMTEFFLRHLGPRPAA